MRVITASRRTDVPAFYTPWLLERLRAGHCHVLNPVSGELRRVSLAPADVAVLGLFTRDPRPLLPHLHELAAVGFRMYAHITVTGYPAALEPRSLPLEQAVAAVRAVSEVLGPQATVWRYDPIVLTPEFDRTYHERRFEGIADALSGHVRECYVSFVDPYTKTQRNVEAAGVSDVAYSVKAPHLELAGRMLETARDCGIELRSCAEPVLEQVGLRSGSCVDRELVWRLRPGLRLRQQPTRDGCGCAQAVDIGAYHTCAFGCAYCYATETPETGRAKLAEHDREDSILWRPPRLRNVELDAFTTPSRRRAPEAPTLF